MIEEIGRQLMLLNFVVQGKGNGMTLKTALWMTDSKRILYRRRDLCNRIRPTVSCF